MPKGDRELLKADIEDGHTPIANLLLEALAIVPLSGVEKGAVLALWRVTYGWVNGNKRRTEANLSFNRWATLLNTNPVYAGRVVNNLIKKAVFNRVDLGKGKGYCYSMNTRVNQWVGGILNGLHLTERFSLPPTKRYRDLYTKQFTPPATNLALLNKDKESINKEDPDIEIKDKEQLFLDKTGQSVEKVRRILKGGPEAQRVLERTKKHWRFELKQLGIKA